MSAVFLDANVLIYHFEAHPEFGPLVRRMLQRALERGFELCTSALAAAEVLTGARLVGDAALERRYQEFFDGSAVRLLPFAASTVPYFVGARLLPGVKAPDAVHLACAAQHGVDVFVTHDMALTRHHLPGVNFIVDLRSDLFGADD